ncbi:MAG: acyl-CoA dehydrogenase family protein [Alphaproteobacteria bacterium]
MDFGFSEENERFRAVIRLFIADHVTPEILQEMRDGAAGAGIGPLTRELILKIGERGWIGMSWPKEYGGQDADIIHQYIFEEELSRARVPLNLGNFIEQAPAIMQAGTEAQKAYFLPRLVRGEVTFALGYTEPSGGTDLASLKTRAVEDEDGFVINGQKVFTTRAESSSHIYLMARTDPDASKHKGISIFLVPMDTPGITVRPLWTLPDGRTNEVFLEDVRVPKDSLLGARNEGWYIGASALNLGRAGARRYCIYVAPFEDLLNFLQNDDLGRELADDPVVRDKVAELYCESQVARLFTMRSLSMVRRGVNPPYEISSEKIWGPEFQVRTTEAASQILGPYHQLWDGDDAPNGGSFPRQYVNAMVSTFGHGSTQVMRTAVARRGLNLPKE